MDPDLPGSGGGETATWRDTLPPELRSEAMLANVPDVATLAKNYVHTQRMIGDRIPKPKADWKPEQFADFWNNLGRPDAPEKYKLPEFKFTEGFPEVNKDKLNAAIKELHGAGLTQAQLEKVLNIHFSELDAGFKADIEARKQSHATGMEKLRERFGGEDKLKVALDKARGALRKMGGEQQEFEELMTFLEDKNLDNNPAFIVLLSKVGDMMMEDRAHGGMSQFTSTQTQAIAEIERLQLDQEFMRALDNKAAPGHNEALAKWNQLHYVGYPGKQDN